MADSLSDWSFVSTRANRKQLRLRLNCVRIEFSLTSGAPGESPRKSIFALLDFWAFSRKGNSRDFRSSASLCWMTSSKSLDSGSVSDCIRSFSQRLTNPREPHSAHA